MTTGFGCDAKVRVRLGKPILLHRVIRERMVAAMKTSSTVVLQPTQKLAGVRKEWHTRKQGGRDVCYVATDRLGEWLVLTQKLPLLTAWINETLGNEPSQRVSTTALYEGVDRGKNASRVGEWVKGRWAVKTVDIAQASEEFENARKGVSNAAVVAAEPSCYVVCV